MTRESIREEGWVERALSSSLVSLVLDSVSITISLVRVYLGARLQTHRVLISSSMESDEGKRRETRLRLVVEGRGRGTWLRSR